MQDTLRGHKMRATGACIGAVIGLVTVTPAAGKVQKHALASSPGGGFHTVTTGRFPAMGAGCNMSTLPLTDTPP